MSPQGVRALDPAAIAGATGLNKQKHVNYWKRCLKTFLPQQYTSTDSNRMLLAFFIVSALDLLGVLHDQTTPQEREDYVQWIYACQHPEGGFRGFPGTDFGELRSEQNAAWDPANVPATYLALSSLLVLKDDLSRVKRRECLHWLPRLQRPDGSFGETLGENGSIEGGFDSRFGYCAMVTRWILRGAVEGDVDGVPDINVEQLVACIRSAQAYDGGISEAPFHEAHGGFTYCAIGILYFLRRLPAQISANRAPAHPGMSGVADLNQLVCWLLLRQTDVLEEDDLPNSESDKMNAAAVTAEESLPKHLAGLDEGAEGLMAKTLLEGQPAGFNGRCNKIADTCYCFWVAGALSMLQKCQLSDREACRSYLLDKTAHLVGGFGKSPGEPPDIYHSYLGLAALSLLGDTSVKTIVPGACFSQEAARHLESLGWRQDITGSADPGLPQGFTYN